MSDEDKQKLREHKKNWTGNMPQVELQQQVK